MFNVKNNCDSCLHKEICMYKKDYLKISEKLYSEYKSLTEKSSVDTVMSFNNITCNYCSSEIKSTRKECGDLYG